MKTLRAAMVGVATLGLGLAFQAQATVNNYNVSLTEDDGVIFNTLPFASTCNQPAHPADTAGSCEYQNASPLPSAGGAASPPTGGWTAVTVSAALYWDDGTNEVGGTLTFPSSYTVQGGPDSANNFSEATISDQVQTLVANTASVTDNGDGTSTVLMMVGCTTDVGGAGCIDGNNAALFNGPGGASTETDSGYTCSNYNTSGVYQSDCSYQPTQTAQPQDYAPWEGAIVNLLVNNGDKSLISASVEGINAADLFNFDPKDDFKFYEIYTTNPVPVPAALWLFGSALGLLGWVRRRISA
jgi:hypothetical protein